MLFDSDVEPLVWGIPIVPFNVCWVLLCRVKYTTPVARGISPTLATPSIGIAKYPPILLNLSLVIQKFEKVDNASYP